MESHQEVEQIVTFGEGLPINESPAETNKSPSATERAAIIGPRAHTIENFLERPVKIASGSLATTVAGGTIVQQFNLPEKVIQSSSQIVQKLTGFVGFHAKVNVRVDVVSQPFQSGLTHLSYAPYAQYTPDKMALITTNLTSLSSLPGVDVDIATAHVLKTDADYVSPRSYYNLVTGQGTFGTFYYWVYSPLSSLAASSIDYNIYVWFTNVELVGATSAPIYLQDNPVDAPRRVMYAQIGIENTLTKNVGSMVNKIVPVTGLFKAINAAASAASSLVSPLLTTLTAFAFSKPVMQSLTAPFKQRTLAYGPNFDGNDGSHKLALSSNNTVNYTSQFAGSENDEMNINHIASRFGFIRKTSMSTTQGEGIILASFPVTPSYSVPGALPRTVVFPFVGFLANLFAFWRGSLVYRFKFVKNGFYSGRVRFTYVPYSLTVPAVHDFERCYTGIFDLSSGNNIDVSIPYVATQLWQETGSDRLDELTFPQCTGVLYVSVESKLVATTTVSSSISIICEFAGGDDFQLAVPQRPIYHLGPPVADDLDATDSDKSQVRLMHAQMLVDNAGASNTFSVEPLVLGDPTSDSRELACTLTVGETVSSLRALIKRAEYLGTTAISASINPWVFFYSTGSYRPDDFISYIASIFQFFKGSMRYKFVPVLSASVIRVGLPINQPQPAFLVPTVGGMGLVSSQIVVNTALEGAAEVEVPFYHRSDMIPTDYNQPSSRLNFDRLSVPPVTLSWEVDADHRVYRSCGDDATFGYLLAPPVLFE